VIDRRQLLWGAGAACVAGPALAAGLPVPAAREIGFKVLRNGSVIGEHHLKFSGDDDDLTVEINVALLVTLAGIPVFRYNGAATERWSGGIFSSLDSKVNDNGNQLAVTARKIDAGYDVQGTHVPRYTCPPNTMPLTYWNKAMLNGTILNIQTAHSYPATVTSPGWNNLPTAGGGTVLAQRFDVTGKLHLSVWYDQMNQWSGLEFHVSGDETYQKIVA